MKIFTKKFIALSAVFTGLGLSSALAADLIAESPVTVTSNWTGGYIGTQAGYGWGEADHQLDGLSRTTSNHVDGGLIGAYGGYNYQLSNNVVLGIDIDIGWGGQQGGPDAVIVCPCDPNQPNKASASIKWSAAVRGRLGYAVDSFLPYISGGLVMARVRGHYDYVDVNGTIDDTMTGWTLGAGFDYAFADNLMFRTEYRYSDFGDMTRQPFLPAFTNTQTLNFASQDLRIGIAYRF